MSRRLIFILSTFLFAWSVAQAQPTYSKEVSRILQEKCQMCHRPNDIAPMPLLTYDDAQLWMDDIKRVVSDKIMPPWKPVPGFGEFRDSYGLSDAERQTLISWVNAGAPMGDPAEIPPATAPTGDWQLGDPDLIVQMTESYTPPRGGDMYRCFVVTNPFDQAMNVRAVDVLPGNRPIVHHVIMYIDEKGASANLSGKDGSPGYTCFGGPGFDIDSINAMLGGWAPGTLPRYLPDGIGVQIPKGARLVMQVHYFPQLKTGEDVTKVGLYFAKAPIEKRLFYIPVVNTRFKIPPGDPQNVVNATFDVPPFADLKIVQIFPHMHLLGKKINVELTPRGRSKQPLIFIDDWDFKYQGFYNYKDQIPVASGSSVRVTCTFDNSANNPRNPNDPLKEVGWGEGTQDEMCLSFFGVTFDFESLLRL